MTAGFSRKRKQKVGTVCGDSFAVLWQVSLESLLCTSTEIMVLFFSNYLTLCSRCDSFDAENNL
jgi:hypothetical protein